MEKSTSLEKFRGLKNSPILVIGNSLPAKKITRDNLSELLDRRHVIYKSIIIPLKYYINEYLISRYGLKLPNDFNNKNDIFGYVNGFTNIFDDALKTYKFDEDTVKQVLNSGNYKIILCMGKDVFYNVKSLFEKEYGYNKITVEKSGGQIRELGRYFTKNIENYKKFGGKVILPLLHNSANLSFQYTDRFIEPYIDNNEQYISYNEYISERIAEILVNDPEIKSFLVNLKDIYIMKKLHN